VTQAQAGSLLRLSPLETARFDLRVFRGDVETIDADALADEIERERVDVAILRLPAREIGNLHALARRGLAPIVADTQVRYGIDLAPPRVASDGDARLSLRPATPDDADRLARMARAIFADYVTHYHANPLFAYDKALDGYAEWAARHVAADDGSAAWLVEWDGELAGFSCYRVDRVAGTAIGVLNGILPAARGHGVYRAMLRKMLVAFADMRVARFEIATQVHNVTVQRAWTALGLSLQGASCTIHVNALRGPGQHKPRVNIPSDSAEDVRESGRT
jgi:RimJ/RimL family protein N-acetyltransferase